MKDVKARRFVLSPAFCSSIDPPRKTTDGREGNRRQQLLSQFVASPLKGFIVFLGTPAPPCTTSTTTPVIRTDTSVSQSSFWPLSPNTQVRVNPLQDTYRSQSLELTRIIIMFV